MGGKRDKEQENLKGWDKVDRSTLINKIHHVAYWILP